MIEEVEQQETSLADLIELIERDDLPTNIFTIEDVDPMVILGKINEVVAHLENIEATIPTKTSELENDGDGTSMFITEQFLDNSYITKARIINLFNRIGGN